jgi:hypothetical protein
MEMACSALSRLSLWRTPHVAGMGFPVLDMMVFEELLTPFPFSISSASSPGSDVG